MITLTNRKIKSNWNKLKNNKKLIGKGSNKLWKDFIMIIGKNKDRKLINQSKEHKNHKKKPFINLDLEEIVLQRIKLLI